MTVRVNLEPVYILHRRKYKENSFIIDFFSESYGKVRAISRSISKNRRSLVQPFTPYFASWTLKTELATLNNIEARGAALSLSQAKLICGFYINELIMKSITFSDPFPDTFAVYESTLKNLISCNNVEVPLRLFEKTLISEIGYAIPFEEVTSTTSPAGWYQYSPKSGLSPCNPEDARAISYDTIINLQNNSIHTKQHLKESKLLLKSALDEILKNTSIKSKMLWS